jgi:ATP sulfurylase
MRTRPSGISEDAWQEAIRAGFHATPEVSRREVEEILVAALPALGVIPTQARSAGSEAPAAPVAR